MPDPKKVKAAVIGCVLVIGASIGIGLGVSQKNKNANANGAIVENQNSAIPGNDGVQYKDPSPTKAKDILDELEHNTARYGSYNGNYIDYNSNPLEQMEDKERSGDDDDDGHGEIADWDDADGWTDDGWDDDGWDDVSDCKFVVISSIVSFILRDAHSVLILLPWSNHLGRSLVWFKQVFEEFVWWLPHLSWL